MYIYLYWFLNVVRRWCNQFILVVSPLFLSRLFLWSFSTYVIRIFLTYLPFFWCDYLYSSLFICTLLGCLHCYLNGALMFEFLDPFIWFSCFLISGNWILFSFIYIVLRGINPSLRISLSPQMEDITLIYDIGTLSHFDGWIQLKGFCSCLWWQFPFSVVVISSMVNLQN